MSQGYWNPDDSGIMMAYTSSLSHKADDLDNEELARHRRMVIKARNARILSDDQVETEAQKIVRIRKELADGTYFTKEKFAIAVSRMLNEVRG